MKEHPSRHILPAITQTISLREGMLMEAGGVSLQLYKLRPPEVLLQDVQTNECRATTEDVLISAIQTGEVICEGVEQRRTLLEEGIAKLRDSEHRIASQAALEVAAAKLTWLEALRRHGVVRLVDRPWVHSLMKRLVADELKDVQWFELTTLAETERRIRKADGDVTAAIPDYASRGGAGGSRIDPRALQVAKDVLRTAVDSKSFTTKLNIIRDVETQIQALNTACPQDPIKQPGHTTIRRVISREMPAYEFFRVQKGVRKANSLFREQAYSRDTATRPLEASEYDDVDTGVFLVDEMNGLPWGRGWLTDGIDQCTAVPLGYHMGEKERSYESMMGAICHSLLPKPYVEEAGHWDGYGCQGVMKLDRARYNFCVAAKQQSAALGVLLSAARPRGPTEKSTIEHYNHIIKSDFCPTLPGWKGDSGDREAIDEGIGTAVLTIQDFERLYVKWVCGVYLNIPGDDGKTARQRWTGFYKGFGPAVRYSSEQLALFRLVPKLLRFRESGGVYPLRLRYASDELARLRKQLGPNAQVLCFVDRLDLTYLMAENPWTKSRFRVECVEDPRYVRGLTAYQQSMIIAKCRQEKNKNPSIGDLMAARRALQKQVEDARKVHKLRVQSWARKMKGIVDGNGDYVPETKTTSGVQKERLMTELEHQMMDLEALTEEMEKESE